MYELLYALLLTILIEFIVIWPFLRKKEKITLILLYIVLINCFTLPLATYGYNYILPNLVLIEFLIIIIESLLIKLLFKIKYQWALLISTEANLVTVAVGFVI